MGHAGPYRGNEEDQLAIQEAIVQRATASLAKKTK
jgi:hypothetical protein